ncbi:hypothetical protein L596_016755 [Steinernema carpocapsae]|uniref:Uncharacterized protein n=1 Tax=Steinernema carpocapsae TaxID=34508 RepID=A0A4U5NKC6_STECR|nr:hypothetical protein L596_016755 [Steinernema carpocapsae]
MRLTTVSFVDDRYTGIDALEESREISSQQVKHSTFYRSQFGFEPDFDFSRCLARKTGTTDLPEWVHNQRHTTNFVHGHRFWRSWAHSTRNEFPITPSPNAPRNTPARSRNYRLSGLHERSENTDPAAASLSPRNMRFAWRATYLSQSKDSILKFHAFHASLFTKASLFSTYKKFRRGQGTTMDSVPLLFRQSVVSLLPDEDLCSLSKLKSKWSDGDRKKLDYSISLRFVKTENSEKWFFYFREPSNGNRLTAVDSGFKQNVRLTGVSVKREDNFDKSEAFSRAKEISVAQIQEILIPFIESNLVCHPRHLSIEANIPIPNINFRLRIFSELCLPYQGPESMDLLRRHAERGQTNVVCLLGEWPQEAGELLFQILAIPACCGLYSEKVKLPPKAFDKFIYRFLDENDDGANDLDMKVPIDIKFSNIKKYLDLFVDDGREFKERDICCELEGRELNISLENGTLYASSSVAF